MHVWVSLCSKTIFDTENIMYSLFLVLIATLTGERDIDAARDNHLGQWDSEEDFAWHIFDEMYAYQIPESMHQYFNISRFAEDLFDFDYYFENGHVFFR